MEFSSIYWLSEIHGKTEALLLSKYQILPADEDDDDDGSDDDDEDEDDDDDGGDGSDGE